MIIIKKGEIPDYDFKLAIKKPIPVKVFQMPEDFEVETMEGKINGKAGDFLMVGARGEMWPHDKEIFFEVYDFVEPEK